MYIYIFKYFKLYRILKNALQNCYYYFILHIKLAALVFDTSYCLRVSLGFSLSLSWVLCQWTLTRLNTWHWSDWMLLNKHSVHPCIVLHSSRETVKLSMLVLGTYTDPWMWTCCFEDLNDLHCCSVAGDKSTVSAGPSWCEAEKMTDIKGCYDERWRVWERAGGYGRRGWICSVCGQLLH